MADHPSPQALPVRGIRCQRLASIYIEAVISEIRDAKIEKSIHSFHMA
jgi:hypothetical protein